MLKSDKIRLRAIEPEDLDLMYLIENDTELWPFGNQSVPFSYYSLRQYITNSTNDFFHDRQLRLVIERNDGTAIGFIDIQNYEPLHHRAEVGIVLLQTFQHQGLATDALSIIATYASQHLGLHQLYAIVPVHNTASRSLFLRSGFQQTARFSQWIHSDQDWQDAWLFQLVFSKG